MADNPKIDTIELEEVQYDIDIKIDATVLTQFAADGLDLDTEE